jgi:hypothetical protein
MWPQIRSLNFQEDGERFSFSVREIKSGGKRAAIQTLRAV